VICFGGLFVCMYGVVSARGEKGDLILGEDMYIPVKVVMVTSPRQCWIAWLGVGWVVQLSNPPERSPGNRQTNRRRRPVCYHLGSRYSPFLQHWPLSIQAGVSGRSNPAVIGGNVALHIAAGPSRRERLRRRRGFGG